MSGYNWLRDGLIPAQSAFIETLWIYAWITFAIAPVLGMKEPFSLGWLLLLAIGPTLFGRWLDYHFQHHIKSRTSVLALFVILLFGAFIKIQTLPQRSVLDWHWVVETVFPWVNLEVAGQNVLALGWFVGLALLARGLWLASSDVDDDSAKRWFLGGLGAFLFLFVVLQAAAPNSTTGQWLGLLLAIYFCVGLTWLALVKRQGIEEEALAGSPNSAGLSWLWLFGSISATMVLVAGAVSGLGASSELSGVRNGFLNLVVSILYLIWNILGIPFRLFPAGWFFLRCGILSSVRMRGPGCPTNQDEEFNQAVQEIQQLNRASNIHLPQNLLQGILFAVVVVVLAVLITRTLRAGWFRRGGDEERTSLWSWQLFLSQLRSLFALSRRQLSLHRPQFFATTGAVGAAPAAPDEIPASVRGLYVAVLRWSRSQGHPRHPARTPAEFSAELERVVPTEVAGVITSAYVKVRYGEADIESDEVQNLITTWRETATPQINPLPRG